MNKITREHIYLAALLHDVGKIGQRSTNYNPSDAECELICPHRGYYSHKHVWWTQQFFREIEENKEFWNKVEIFAKYHHNASVNEKNTVIVSCADKLSAGIDREYGADEKNKDFRAVSLTSILSRLSLSNNYSDKQLAFFDLEPLSSKNIYPDNTPNKANTKKYLELWNGLKNDFKKILKTLSNFDNFDFTLLHILRRYMWLVPSDTQSFADISLFEHSKTTAAFAVAIYDYCQANPNDCLWSNDCVSFRENVFPFAFVGVDISGIQDFIYNIITNKAAKSLKGRSFYLELLTLALIEKFKNIFNAFYGQIIYSAGGKFFALVANVDIDNKIKQFQEDVEKKLWEEHKDKLAVAIEAIKFRPIKSTNQIFIEGIDDSKNIAELWSALSIALAEKKNKKYFNIISENFDTIFNPEQIDEKPTVCAVTGLDLPENKAVPIDEHSDVLVAPIVRKQVQLGDALKNAKWLIISKNQLNSNIIKAQIKILDTYFSLIPQNVTPLINEDYKAMIFNRPENFLDNYIEGKGFGYIFYAGNKVPTIKEKEKTTDQLALTKNGKTTMLGVLRMDVDNLGKIFSIGLPNKSFGALATLSYMLNLFFTKYLAELRNAKLRNDDNYRDWVNILYAGGDDLFVYGRWKEVLDFAYDVKRKFSDFVKNDEITISAGLVFVHGKFPIAKAALLSGEAEEKAKNFGKNAITFFGETLHWKDFDTVKNSYKSHFIKFKKYFSSGFLQRMIDFYNMKKAENKTYLWNSLYYLARVSEKFKDNSEIYKYLINLMKNLFQNPSLYKIIALASRWAEKELKL